MVNETTNTGIANQIKMFGEPLEDLRILAAEILHGITDEKVKEYRIKQYACSLLSDAQEIMNRGGADVARQWINQAKFFLTEKF